MTVAWLTGATVGGLAAIHSLYSSDKMPYLFHCGSFGGSDL